MPTGLIAAEANQILDALGTEYPYIQLHMGDPGAAGTANVAVETDRVLATWAAASAGGKTTSANLVWTAVAGSEDYTHFSGRSAATGGTVGYTGVVTANAVTVGDTFTIPAGDLDLALTVAT